MADWIKVDQTTWRREDGDSGAILTRAAGQWKIHCYLTKNEPKDPKAMMRFVNTVLQELSIVPPIEEQKTFTIPVVDRLPVRMAAAPAVSAPQVGMQQSDPVTGRGIPNFQPTKPARFEEPGRCIRPRKIAENLDLETAARVCGVLSDMYCARANRYDYFQRRKGRHLKKVLIGGETQLRDGCYLLLHYYNPGGGFGMGAMEGKGPSLAKLSIEDTEALDWCVYLMI